MANGLQVKQDAAIVELMKLHQLQHNGNPYICHDPYWMHTTEEFFGQFTDAALRYIEHLEAQNKALRTGCEDAIAAIDLAIEPVYHAKIGALHVTLGNAMSVCREALGESE